MYQRIMVPLDGSSFGASAIPAALEIGSRAGAAIDLVHVHIRIPDDGLPAFTPYQYQNVLQRHREWDATEFEHELDALLALASDHARESGLAVTARVLAGTVVGALEAEADRFHADLIVMASHARMGLERARQGSVADYVVRHAAMPVLVLKPSKEGGAATTPRVRRVLVPLDGSHFSAGAIEAATAFAGLHEAEVRFIHVVDRDSGTIARPEGIEVERIQARGITEGILDAARDWEADVIALATHGRGGLSRVLTGSTTTDLLARTHLPLLLKRPVMHTRATTSAVEAHLRN